ncbi:hypothetical protein LMG28614_06674 [Paraburkholderia ultramafica]|uniref:eCIS core domain-containing protein n=1 Tax=Paraburkholderia ultramafica TaxID=1544867 RepID=A0A6S7BPA4_9BURK|nr:DUF4157 domain-containing protein [Paraburkholderia ultramafica]CAB3807808.1 hypothetical protein LMG28614_06674 [Paraburkholderia ultramafica]
MEKVSVNVSHENDQRSRQPEGSTPVPSGFTTDRPREAFASGGLLVAAAESVEIQSALLNDKAQPISQRRALARRIGQLRGNFHLQKVISSIRPEPAARDATGEFDADGKMAATWAAHVVTDRRNGAGEDEHLGSRPGEVAPKAGPKEVDRAPPRSVPISRSLDSVAEERIPERHELLDPGKAQHFGKRLGADFSGVTVHSGDDVAESRGASAVTFGSNIHFADGVLKRTGAEEILGHELVHTIQQGAVPVERPASDTPAHPVAAEAEAERLGPAAARGDLGIVRLRAPSASQRKRTIPSSTVQVARGHAAEAKLAAVEARIAKESKETIRARRQQRPPLHARVHALAPTAKGGAKHKSASPEPRSHAHAYPAPKAPATSRRLPSITGARRPAIVMHAGQQAPRAAAVPFVPPPGAAPGAAASSPDANALASVRGPAAALGRDVAAEGSRMAAQIRNQAAAVASAVVSIGERGSTRLRAAQVAATGEIDAQLAAGHVAIAGGEEAAVAAVQAELAAATADVHASGAAETGRVTKEVEEHQSQASRTAADKKASVDATAESEAAVFRDGSDARAARAQQPASAGGETDSFKQEATQKADAQASANFNQDATRVHEGNRDAARSFGSFIDEQVTNFVSSIGQAVPEATGHIAGLVHSATSGLGKAASNVLSSVTALSGQAAHKMEAGAATVVQGVRSGAEALASALDSHAEQRAAEIATHAEQLAATLEQGAQQAGLAVAAAPESTASKLAPQARSQMAELAERAAAELGGLESRVGGQFGEIAQHGVAAIGAAASAAAVNLQSGAAGVATKLASGQAGASRTFQNAVRATGQLLSEAGSQASADMGKAGSHVVSGVEDSAKQAQTDLGKTVDQASTEQQGNLEVVQGKTQATHADIDSSYTSLKSEADSRSSADQRQNAENGGQTFLELLLPKSWTAAIKSWFKDTFGEIAGGIIYGLLSALVPLLIIGGLCLLFEAAAPFIIGGALILGIGLGIYSRFSNFEKDNGRGPGFWEGLALVGLGIADVTGIPQVVEGIVGYRAFAEHNPDGTLKAKMSDFDRAEMITSGLFQLLTLGLGARAFKGKFGGKSVPPDINPPEVKPPEVKPPEVKPPEEKPPEVVPKAPPKVRVVRTGNNVSVSDAVTDALLGLGELKGDGYLELGIYTKEANTTVRGSEVFEAILEEFRSGGDTVRGIRGLWYGEDNLATFNEFIQKKMTPEEAAGETFTGKMAKRSGYPKVRIDYAKSVRNPDGTFKRAELWFDP